MRGDGVASDRASLGGEAVPVTQSSGPTALLTAMAALALLLGTLVYITDRDGSHALLIPDLGAQATGPWFGVLGQWLPSLFHPLAFSLLTAAWLRPSAGPGYGACAAWGAVNIAFEIGQHPQLSPFWADALLAGGAHAAHAALIQPLARYFFGGTFDPGDIVAAVLGSLAAAAVLRIVCKQRECSHAP